MSDYLADLNPQQRRAVQTVSGPVLVLAGPGSGKTRVLTRRIAYLIDEAGVAPWNILAVTFTNKAAREMRERVERLVEDRFGAPLPGQPPRLGGLTIGTFHSVCARVLRIESDAIGFERNWLIYDTADQLALLRSLLRDMNLDEKRYTPQAVRAHISRQKNELVTPDTYVANSYFEEIVGRVYRRYQEALHANNAMDFDDLLTRTTLLLRDNLEARIKYQEKWRYLLVDEFQDTNTVQYELLRLLVNEPAGQRNLFVVGDEDQSIYRFRGADYRNVLRFREDYPEATVVLLEQNYRSTQSILDVANAVIANNRNRTPKQLHTENGRGLAATVYEAYNEVEEAAYVLDEIERLTARGEFGPGDIAVMYRTNAQSRALEEAFVMRQMKYKLVGGTRFYERKEIKDALAYMRLIHNPADSVSLDRIINEPARGIGPKTLDALKSWAADLGVNVYTALQLLHHGPEHVSRSQTIFLPSAAYEPPPLGKRAEHALVDFAAMLERWVAQQQAGHYESVAELLDTVLQQSGYIDALRDGTDEGEERFENLQELRQVAAEYRPGMVGLQEGQSALALFLEEVSLVSDADEVEEGAGAVTLMTLHTAKGLEYPVVFIVGMEDGILPHSRSLESGDPEEMDEERRLCYVGITRAKRRLYLVHAFKRGLWGGSEVQRPSRFLEEIPTDLLTGMVDRRARREAAYSRATAWDVDDDRPRRGRRTGDDTWASSPSRQERGRSQQTYWSPGSESQTGSRPAARPAKADGKADKAAGSLQFKRRDSVQHPKFGVGTVIESNLVGGEEEVTVAFPGVGIKRLLADLAGLKKL
ncbi:MAG TPA: UvrD-helicase domain-containing protein [Caldilineaceae bacterium]|nr:UvrD-helicase domain-containing protein [Caldilineaceae bacterium]